MFPGESPPSSFYPASHCACMTGIMAAGEGWYGLTIVGLALSFAWGDEAIEVDIRLENEGWR